MECICLIGPHALVAGVSRVVVFLVAAGSMSIVARSAERLFVLNAGWIMVIRVPVVQGTRKRWERSICRPRQRIPKIAKVSLCTISNLIVLRKWRGLNLHTG